MYAQAEPIPDNQKFCSSIEADHLLTAFLQHIRSEMNSSPCLFELSFYGEIEEIKKVSFNIILPPLRSQSNPCLLGGLDDGDPDYDVKTHTIGNLYSPLGLDITDQKNPPFFVTIGNRWPHEWLDVKFPFSVAFQNEEQFVRFVNHNCGHADGIKAFENIGQIAGALSELQWKSDDHSAIELHFAFPGKNAFM